MMYGGSNTDNTFNNVVDRAGSRKRITQGKLLTMKEYVNNAEVETKASRETIMRLVSEAEKEQRNNSVLM